VVNDIGTTLHGDNGDPAPGDRVVAEIVAAGGEAIAHHASIAEPEGAQSLVDLAVERFGTVDVLVNNAGILRDKTFQKMSLEDFEAVLRVHLMGTVFCTHAAWPVMTANGYGRIVVTTSGSATNGNFGQSNYAAAKLGVVGLMNVLALEGVRKGVLINAIAPGAATRMTADLIPNEIRDYLAPGLVSPVVAYLCSESCTDTGCIIWSVAGKVSRVFYAETPGVQFDPSEPLHPDDVEAAWPRIIDADGAEPAAPGPIGDAVQRLARMGLIG
jgi:NAD(P)-dependent dehydrogenase (short-subunit alcohol dehydrogenase family)